MKIYFAGSHSSGKSTLSRFVSEKYKLHFISEVARSVLAEKELGLDSLRTSLDIVNNFQKEVFYRQFEEEKKYTEFVSDRSFDNLAYLFNHGTDGHKYINDPKLIEYINNIKNDKSVIFFVRPSKATMKQDGVRESLSWDGMIAIDSMIKMLFEIFNINYVSISSDSMQERIRTIDCVLGLMK